MAGRSLDLSEREPSFGVIKYADRLGGRNVNAVQVAARLDTSSDLTVDYHFDYTHSKNVGRAVQLLGAPSGSSGSLANVILAAQGPIGQYPGTGGITNFGQSRMKAVANATGTEKLEVQGHSLTIGWKVDDTLTVKSISAYRQFKQHPTLYDMSSSGGLRFSEGQFYALLTGNAQGLFDPAVQPGPDDGFFSLLSVRSTSQKQFSEEVQFLFDFDRLHLTSGLFYFHENSPATNVLGIFQPAPNNSIKPTPFDQIFGSGVTKTRAINDSMAGYGQLTWATTDEIELALGLRYTIDDRSTNLISITSAAQAGGLISGNIYKSSYKRLNYTAIATYRPNNDITSYAKVASGYVAGGVLGAIPYNPESLTSYELGLKSQMFNNRLRANLSAFYSNYKGLQVRTFINGVDNYQNAGKARIWGLEGEFQAAPFRGLTLDANIGYTNFKYQKFISGGIDIARIINVTKVPKWSARFGGQYTVMEMSNGANVYVSTDNRYRSGMPLNSMPSGSAELNAMAYQKAYVLSDVRAGISFLPIGGAEINLSAWAKNIFNTDRAAFGPTVIIQSIVPDMGRTYGLDLSFKF